MLGILNVEEVVILLGTHIEHQQIDVVVVDGVQQFAGVDLHLAVGQPHPFGVEEPTPAGIGVGLAQHDQQARPKDECPSRAITPARFVGQVTAAHYPLQLLRPPEHEQGHQDDEQNNHACGQAQPIHNGVAPQITGVPKVLIQPDCLAKHEDAEQHPADEENPVYFEGSGRNQRRAGAKATQNKPHTHHQPADNARPKIGGVHPNEVVIQQTDAGGQENQHHCRHNRPKHHLQNG